MRRRNQGKEGRSERDGRGEFCKSSSFHLCLDISFVLSGWMFSQGRRVGGMERGEKRESVCLSVFLSTVWPETDLCSFLFLGSRTIARIPNIREDREMSGKDVDC